jgi:Flp pilus assembly protein TadG
MTREPFRPFFRRLLRCERGDPIIEFIFIVPLTLVLVFGVIEVGRILWFQHFITKGARDGTRYLTRVPLAGGTAACETVTGDAVTYATNLARSDAYWGTIAPANITVTLCPVDHAGTFYGPDPLRMVRMTAAVPVAFPILDAFLDTGPLVTFTIFNEARHIGQ